MHFQRPIEWCDVAVSESIEIKTDETRDRFYFQDPWLAKARFCKKHTRQQLVAMGQGGEVEQVMRRLTVAERCAPGRDENIEWEPKPNEFRIRASFKCKLCHSAYARVPREFWATSLETFDSSTPERANALRIANKYAEAIKYSRESARGPFALLVGPCGTGKSRLAANILQNFKLVSSLFLRQRELTDVHRINYSRKDIVFKRNSKDDDDDSYETPIAEVQRQRLLVFDEIACNPLASDELSLIDELIKHRYDERMPTILISNHPLDELKEIFGDALIDRIRHATIDGEFIVQFNGQSYRRTGASPYL
jgi:DNA replication protein DnaC